MASAAGTVVSIFLPSIFLSQPPALTGEADDRKIEDKKILDSA